MNKIISLEKKLKERKLDKNIANFNWTDPCSKCDDKKDCNYTCSEANDWFSILAEIIKRNKKKNG